MWIPSGGIYEESLLLSEYESVLRNTVDANK